MLTDVVDRCEMSLKAGVEQRPFRIEVLIERSGARSEPGSDLDLADARRVEALA